jgi:hypothetical protein
MMYLVAGVPVFTVMLIGRWSSNTFLCYIRRQVLQFSVGILKCMVSNQAQDYFTLPNFDPEHPRTWAPHTNLHSPQQNSRKERLPLPAMYSNRSSRSSSSRYEEQHITHCSQNQAIPQTITSWQGSWPRFGTKNESRNENSHRQILSSAS